MAARKRVSTDGGQGLGASPFAGLDAAGLPDASPLHPANAPKPAPASPTPRRGRVDLQRLKGGRGGKVVTVLSGEGMSLTGPQELDAMLKHFKSRLGCGGKVAGKTVELQGDVRDAVEPELAARGYRVVRVGG